MSKRKTVLKCTIKFREGERLKIKKFNLKYIFKSLFKKLVIEDYEQVRFEYLNHPKYKTLLPNEIEYYKQKKYLTDEDLFLRRLYKSHHYYYQIYYYTIRFGFCKSVEVREMKDKFEWDLNYFIYKNPQKPYNKDGAVLIEAEDHLKFLRGK